MPNRNSVRSLFSLLPKTPLYSYEAVMPIEDIPELSELLTIREGWEESDAAWMPFFSNVYLSETGGGDYVFLSRPEYVVLQAALMGFDDVPGWIYVRIMDADNKASDIRRFKEALMDWEQKESEKWTVSLVHEALDARRERIERLQESVVGR